MNKLFPTNGTAAPQKVKNGVPRNRVKQALSGPPKLVRTTFRTSREMDFFSQRELVTQTGHDVEEWPLVIIKELVDNALDACEEADVPPVITVVCDATGIGVADNGPGLPESTLRGVLDFTVRVSSREAYVSPCRGAQGNALKTLLPMPWVLDPERGKLIVTAHGKRHVLTCGADPISQRAVISDDVSDAKSKNPQPGRRGKKLALSGTEVRLEWGPSADACGGAAWPFGSVLEWDDDEFFLRTGVYDTRTLILNLVTGFALFNPHATFTLDWFGQTTRWEALDPAWRKWKPHQPTSAHWYEQRHLERLIGAYITHDRDNGSDRLVSDLLDDFDGLSGSAKRTRVLTDAGLKRVRLSELVKDGRLDGDRIAGLLAAMRRHTRPVPPARLGVIGEEHLRARLEAMGVLPESFRYSKRTGPPKSKNPKTRSDEKASFADVPWVLESGFGWLGPEAPDSRRIFTGANWSAAIKNPFRSFGGTGEGLETVLANMRATRSEPVVFVLHLAHPRVEYTDRGKSALIVAE